MSPSTVPQTGPFFHQFSVDLNSGDSPAQNYLPPLPTNNDTIGDDPSWTGYRTFGNIDAFGASPHVDYTAPAPNHTNDPGNAPAGVVYLDRHVHFEDSNQTNQQMHAHPDSVPVVANQADTVLPSQFQPFDAVDLNIYNQPWPSTSTGVGYTQNNPTPLTTLPSDNHRGHGPIPPNGHHFAQNTAIYPFEQQHVLAIVVIPGAPAFSIPLRVADLLFTMSRSQDYSSFSI